MIRRVWKFELRRASTCFEVLTVTERRPLSRAIGTIATYIDGDDKAAIVSAISHHPLPPSPNFSLATISNTSPLDH
jgi:hypothetical protein